jgi:putative tryptophan/tyrosine transport system substrate-binding protein
MCQCSSNSSLTRLSNEDPLTFTYLKRIADVAMGDKLPSLHGLREFVSAGGLISYGANLADLFARAAGYVDKILKGVGLMGGDED